MIVYADGLCPSQAAQSRETKEQLDAVLDDPAASGNALFAEATKAADPAASQRLLDRARHAFEREAGVDAVARPPLLSAGAPRELALDHEGKRLAVARDATIAVVDVATMRERHRLRIESDVVGLAFSRLGALAVEGEDGVVNVWRAETGERIHRLPAQLGQAAFAPDGKSFASASKDGVVAIRDVESGEMLQRLEAKHERYSRKQYSPDGKYLAISRPDAGALDVWDVTSATKRHGFPLESLAQWRLVFSPSSDTLRAVSGVGGSVVGWNLATGKNIATHALAGGASVVYFTVDLHSAAGLAVVGGSELELFDIEQEKSLRKLPGSIDWNDGAIAAFSGDGQRVAGTVRHGDVKVWSTSTATVVGTLETGPTSQSLDLTRSLAVAALDGGIRVFQSGADLRVLPAHQRAFFVQLSPDGTRSVSFGIAKEAFAYEVRLWDVLREEPLYQPLEVGSSVEQAHFSPKAKAIQLATSYAVLSWDPSSGHRDDKIQVPQARYIVKPSFSADGRSFAAAEHVRRVVVWDLSDETQRFVRDGSAELTALSLSAGGDLVAIANEGGVGVFGVADGRQRWRVETPETTALAVVEDRDVLVGAVGERIVFWNLDDGTELRRIPDAGRVRRLVAHHDAVAWVTRDGAPRVAPFEGQDDGQVADRQGAERHGVIADIVLERSLKAAHVFTPNAFEIVGPMAAQAAERAVCLIGTRAHPLVLCRERFEQRGLLNAILTAEPPTSDP